MNETPENFDKLVKLLALKRHEVPPPGYYGRMSAEITARLKDEARETRSWWRDLADDASWTQKVWEVLEARPALAGYFGVAISTLMIGGIVYSLTLSQPATVAEVPAPDRARLVFNEPVGALPDPGTASSLLVSSTNPVVDPLGPVGLFDGVRLHRQSTPVNLNLGGN